MTEPDLTRIAKALEAVLDAVRNVNTEDREFYVCVAQEAVDSITTPAMTDGKVAQ